MLIVFTAELLCSGQLSFLFSAGEEMRDKRCLQLIGAMVYLLYSSTASMRAMDICNAALPHMRCGIDFVCNVNETIFKAS